MKYCVVNADDFGMSAGINRGVIEAHTRGILTSTSLMVNMPFSAAAARLSREVPRLGMGLHVALTSEDAEPLLDLDDNAACRAELHAQFQHFQDLIGRPPTHLDAHHNIQRDQRLLPLFQELAQRHGLPLRGHSPVRYFSSFYGQWDGETHLEQISVASLVTMLQTQFGAGFTELSCHPGYVDASLDSSYAREREAELETLCHPTIRATLEALNLRLISFAELPGLLPHVQA